jgi:predicted nucleic acid-binding protein
VSSVVYLDASAILKLVVQEPESEALRSYLAGRVARATSIVGAVESRRFAGRREADVGAALRFVLGGIDLIDLDGAVADRASRIALHALRTLDAIHLASAMELGLDLEALVTYDSRLSSAARELRLDVASPTSPPDETSPPGD